MLNDSLVLFPTSTRVSFFLKRRQRASVVRHHRGREGYVRVTYPCRYRLILKIFTHLAITPPSPSIVPMVFPSEPMFLSSADDYTFYDLGSDGPTRNGSAYSSSSSLTNSLTITRYNPLKKVSKLPSTYERSSSDHNPEAMKVLFNFQNMLSSVSCRLFQRNIASIAVPAFRIIQDNEGIRVEYKVVLNIDVYKYTVWRRHLDFIDLATYCGLQTGLWSRWKLISMDPFHRSRIGIIINAQRVWNELEYAKPLFRSTQVRYLIWKTQKLEEFLTQLLFEIDSPNPLLRFMVE